MRNGLPAAVGLLGALAGCLRSTTRDCGNGRVCPAGLQCANDGAEICVVPDCGNGRIDPGEICDDGNHTSGDGCPADCGVHALLVDGGQFYRRYDVAPDRLFPDMNFPATVSSFRLDKYEITVGRFRAFVEAGMGTQDSAPPSGAGAHPNLPGSGWDANWNAALPLTTADLLFRLRKDLPQLPLHTWTDEPGSNENRPINNLTWYDAMAFCIWDGGYLPTATEWNYAAAGGDQQRAYPWSSPPGSLTIDGSHASYGDLPSSGDLGQARCFGDGSPGCAVTDLVEVGTKPAGDGRWGQSDLSGNVIEWTLDWYSPSPMVPCIDCANLSPAEWRTASNGSFLDVPSGQRASRPYAGPPFLRSVDFGARCARPAS